MIAVLQRVSRAAVRVEGEVVGSIDQGLMILLGVSAEDTVGDAACLAKKIAACRIFCDENDKMNLSLTAVAGGALVISNFTLLADYAHGNRPSYFGAAAPDVASALYDEFCRLLSDALSREVARGRFGAHMDIDMEADGPITIVMDSKVLRTKGGIRA
ncbi:MAG: D-tyrosyl-tRNA(Tyr) deacylase [Ruminococcaceae bacterium]|nr:D-tyrosyl-tRNA(Tyr) deacylase [Oscillospiraceae bacterium]